MVYILAYLELGLSHRLTSINSIRPYQGGLLYDEKTLFYKLIKIMHWQRQE